jgi:DNA end-binding protein Ku
MLRRRSGPRQQARSTFRGGSGWLRGGLGRDIIGSRSRDHRSNAMPRAIKNLDISLGLAIIPVQLFTATSSQGVAFHLPHAKCGSRIQMRLECPIHGPVPREETVRGFETSKDEYVRFEPEELKALEQASSSALVIDSFVPEGAVDPVYFENTYYLGADKNGERGYRLLVQALEQTHRLAVGTFTWRGKTTPIASRPGRRAEDPRSGADARRAADH